MDFYGIAYLNTQSNLNDYIKYFVIFAALICLIILFSLHLRHRMQTKYRDLAMIVFLLLLFLLGVQYTDYLQNQSNLSQTSQMVSFVKQIAKEKQVKETEVYVNSTQIKDGMIIKLDDSFYQVKLNVDQTSYILQKSFLVNRKINIVK